MRFGVAEIDSCGFVSNYVEGLAAAQFSNFAEALPKFVEELEFSRVRHRLGILRHAVCSVTGAERFTNVGLMDQHPLVTVQVRVELLDLQIAVLI
ncbi:MAG: hypothetical protein ACLQMT_06515 [Candidatus Acidiferrales bacterium]